MEFILILPLVGFMGLMASVYLGIALAPFSAITCGLLARRRGLNAWGHALAGGIFSVLMVVPSVYLVLRLLNKRPPAELTYLVYLAVFALWFLGTIFAPLGLLLLDVRFSSSYEPDSVLSYGTHVMALIVNSTALVSWIVWWNRRKPNPEDSDKVLPPVGYVLPFFMAPVGLVVWLALGHVEQWIEQWLLVA